MKPSKVCLGTAQLGMRYGINNVYGQPGREESLIIIKTALANGITTFDTAPAYGESEKILGWCLQELGALGQLVSKIPRLDWKRDRGSVAEQVSKTVQQSLVHLGVDRLHACLFHHFNDMDDQEQTALLQLLELKEAGLVEKIGASVYTPEEAEVCLENPFCEVIQVPFNLADRRLLAVDFFRRARASKKVVFVRSVFLQGLMFKAELPAELADFDSHRQWLARLASEEGMTMAELALRYALSFDDIDSVIIGVETIDQLQRNLAIIRRGRLPDRLVTMINDFPSAPEQVIDPRRWPKTPPEKDERA